MKYHALFVSFEKMAKFDLSTVAIRGGALWVHQRFVNETIN